MAKYKLTKNGVVDTETNAHIPDAPGNRHWIEYQEWLAEGNIPDPEDPEPDSIVDPRIALINDIQTINDIKSALLELFGLNT